MNFCESIPGRGTGGRGMRGAAALTAVPGPVARALRTARGRGRRRGTTIGQAAALRGPPGLLVCEHFEHFFVSPVEMTNQNSLLWQLLGVDGVEGVFTHALPSLLN